jgi:hypothetical protein
MRSLLCQCSNLKISRRTNRALRQESECRFSSCRAVVGLQTGNGVLAGL